MNSRIKEDVHKLFEFWCEVTRPERGQKVTGIIIESFPESFHDEQIITKIPDFAYPCDFENDSVQTYSFVLTSDDSKWRFGFCRHDPKTQTAMVLVTYLPWHDTFLRLLGVLGELRRSKSGEFESFLAEAYNKGVPEPGSSLKLFYNHGTNYFMFQHPSQFQLPSIPENHNLNLYYNFVDPKNMIAVFAAMLAERRIIFTSRRLDKLSSCIQAANAFLYPMVWQHIFIPVLPMKMKDILSAPMPYLMGVPEAVLLSMTPEELGDVVILNCDTKIFQTPFDDVRQMPPELISQLKKQLSNSHEHIGDRVSKIFLGVLVQLIGGYRDAVKFSQGQKITWDRETFIESRPPHLRPFLSRMMELQIFQQFIDERLNMLNTGLGFSDEFELETLRYAEKMGKRGKNYKEFLKNVKDKTNPAVKSAVKSVKEGSRGVKIVYKDLKSKLRDITPPKSHFHTSLPQTTSTHETGHRSAPNSPVFSKRPQTAMELNYSASGVTSTSTGKIRKAAQNSSSMQTSNSQSTMNGFISYTSYNNVNINNNHLSKSPTISPSSSLCSSDMNISQELQNHPLFKTPAVDRSLKPSNSMEYTPQRPARFGAPITATCNKSSQTPDVPLGNLCIIDDDDDDDDDDDSDDEEDIDGGEEVNNEDTDDEDEDDRATTTPSFTNDYLFDTPPDMPSPPVPPKRTHSESGSFMKVTPNKYDDFGGKTNYQLQKGGMSASFAFENNFVNNQKELVSPNKMWNSSLQAPIPAPRQKLKEQTAQSTSSTPTATTKDLITLDESNTSFELEDFDPLNTNAKLPPTPVKTKGFTAGYSVDSSVQPSTSQRSNSTSCNTLNMVSAHNPLYPYFSPQHQQPHSQHHAQSSKLKDDDFELLRKYGLDQFSLTNGNSTKSVGQTNWTTFD